MIANIFRKARLISVCLCLAGCLVEPGAGNDEDYFLGFLVGRVDSATAGETSGAGTTTAADSIVDSGDGTITALLSGTTRMYAKCIQADAVGANRYGGAGTGDTCSSGAPAVLQYCSINDNGCNGNQDTDPLDGRGVSEIYASCDGLTMGGHADWRVPTAAELMFFYQNVALAQPTLFPNAFNFTHWTASSSDSLNATLIDFGTGAFSTGSKSSVHRVRCIRIP